MYLVFLLNSPALYKLRLKKLCMKEDERPEYVVHVLNHTILKTKGGKKAEIATTADEKIHYFHDIDGRRLQFPPETPIRPARRRFYCHTLIAILYAKREQWAGWELALEKLKLGELWMTPGPYMSRAMLSDLWEYTMNSNVPEAIFRGTFEDAGVRNRRITLLQWQAALMEKEENHSPE